MEEIKLNVQKADTYLDSAGILLETRDFDSTSSRCYYAMFYMARAVLLTQNIKTDTHSGIHAKFAEHFVKTGIFDRKYSKYLKYAFELRSIGDYSVFLPIDLEVAQDLLRTAQYFCGTLKEYLQKNEYLGQ